MLQPSNPPTYKIVDTDIGAKLPVTKASIDFQKAIDTATRPNPATDIIFQANRAVPDVSALPPMPTHDAIQHSWLTDALTWINHLAPSLTAWLSGLTSFIPALGPLLMGLFTIRLLGGILGRVAVSVPGQRAEAEYAMFVADPAIIERLRRQGVRVILAEGGATFAVPRYHIGLARRAGAVEAL